MTRLWLILLLLPALVYADCKTHTVVVNGMITVCKTCCTSDGNCNTVCF